MKYALLMFLLSTLSIAAFSQSIISADDALQHIGDSVKITSRVLSIKATDSGSTLLHIGNQVGSKPLLIVIKKEANKDFLSEPDGLHLDKIIQVVGRITKFNEKVQIVVTNSNQIKDITPLLQSPRVKF